MSSKSFATAEEALSAAHQDGSDVAIHAGDLTLRFTHTSLEGFGLDDFQIV